MPAKKSKAKKRSKATKPKAKKPKVKKAEEKVEEPKVEEIIEVKKLSPRETVQALLEEQLKLEKEAVSMYNGLLVNFRNPEILRGLTKIRDQKIEHVEVVREALESLK